MEFLAHNLFNCILLFQMSDFNLMKAVLQLQEAKNATEEKATKVRNYMEQTENILFGSVSMCHLPKEKDDLLDRVNEERSHYEKLKAIDYNDETVLAKKEQELLNLYDRVIKRISQND